MDVARVKMGHATLLVVYAIVIKDIIPVMGYAKLPVIHFTVHPEQLKHLLAHNVKEFHAPLANVVEVHLLLNHRPAVRLLNRAAKGHLKRLGAPHVKAPLAHLMNAVSVH